QGPEDSRRAASSLEDGRIKSLMSLFRSLQNSAAHSRANFGFGALVHCAGLEALSPPMVSHLRQSPRPAVRLYVVAPCVADPSDLAHKIDDMVGAADVAAVLLHLPESDRAALIDYAKLIIPMVQDKGVAVLLDGHPETVASAEADGAHLTGIEAFTAAV